MTGLGSSQIPSEPFEVGNSQFKLVKIDYRSFNLLSNHLPKDYWSEPTAEAVGPSVAESTASFS